jgi:hypothetical protein
MTVNLNEVAIALTQAEGLASNQNVTDTKEFLAVLGLRWRAMPIDEALAEFEAIRERAGLGSAHVE